MMCYAKVPANYKTDMLAPCIKFDNMKSKENGLSIYCETNRSVLPLPWI